MLPSVDVSLTFMGYIRSPKASQGSWSHHNHPLVTFDTHHMTRLKALLVALRFKFLGAMLTPSQEGTRPIKADAGTGESLSFTDVNVERYTQHLGRSSGRRMTQMRCFPWAETTEGIAQSDSQESGTYSRTRCSGLQARSQSGGERLLGSTGPSGSG